MATTPKWAADIIRDVCFLADVEEPVVVWRKARAHKYTNRAGRVVIDAASFYSSGRSNSAEDEGEDTRLVMTQGTDRKDAKLVLLHELAHWTGPKDSAHDDGFWDRAWELFRFYKIPTRYALYRSATYRAGAVAGARRAGIRVSARTERAAAATRRAR